MLVLSLDSSSTASVALARDGEVLERFDTADTRSHAEALAPAVQDLMARTGLTGEDLDGILVGTGPGPFTGLRAGLVSARALGFAWNLPVYGLCSLDAVAHHVVPLALEAGEPEFVVATDARRKELYFRRYRLTGSHDRPEAVPAGEPGVAAPEDLPGMPCYGSGAGLYPDRVPRLAAQGTDVAPSAADLARAAWALTSRGGALSTDTTPLYLRESDARVPGAPKRATS